MKNDILSKTLIIPEQKSRLDVIVTAERIDQFFIPKAIQICSFLFGHKTIVRKKYFKCYLKDFGWQSTMLRIGIIADEFHSNYFKEFWMPQFKIRVYNDKYHLRYYIPGNVQISLIGSEKDIQMLQAVLTYYWIFKDGKFISNTKSLIFSKDV